MHKMMCRFHGGQAAARRPRARIAVLSARSEESYPTAVTSM
jgi:hypothetical protein